MRNMTKKKIRSATTLELAIRMNYLFAKSDSLPAGEGISLADATECLDIDKELRHRLAKCLGREDWIYGRGVK